MSVLEYGCGPGRLALPLARRPGSVTAVDRSPVMLDLARREAGRHGLGHIVFQTPAELFAAPRTFDLVVCYQVLQRLPPHEAKALLDRLIGLVGPGGVGVFQWPYRTADSQPRRRVALAARARAGRQHPGEPSPRKAGRPSHSSRRTPTTWRRCSRRSTRASFDRPTWCWSITSAWTTPSSSRTEASAPSRSQRVPTRASGVEPRAAADAVSDAELEAFNRAAETYFTSLADWEHHLAKPFSQMEETPTLLMSVAVAAAGAAS